MNTWIAGKDLMKKENFYSSLNMEDITDVDYRRAKSIFKILNSKNMSEYHDLYVQSDTLLLSDVFENFRDRCTEIYEPPWEASLKKTEIRLELLTDVNMLLMVEKRIKGGICHAIHRYEKGNNKYMKNYNKNKESSCMQYLDANNSY